MNLKALNTPQAPNTPSTLWQKPPSSSSLPEKDKSSYRQNEKVERLNFLPKSTIVAHSVEDHVDTFENSTCAAFVSANSQAMT